MATAINVLIIHGIGWGQDGPHYADPLIDGLQREFDRAVRKLHLRDVDRGAMSARQALRFQAVYWAPVTQNPQNALLKLLFPSLNPLRRFNPTYIARKNMVGMLGDVSAYEAEANNEVYKAIHNEVSTAASHLAQASVAERDPEGYAPLTVIGHSLGSVIGSDWVWDHTRRGDRPHLIPDHHFGLVNYVAMGSPMALYALRNNAYGDINTIRTALSAPIQVDPDGGFWLNLYDRQDPIGFPLRRIDAYQRAGVLDVIVHAGNLLTAWNPLSHVGYWRSHETAQWIARKLALDWAHFNSPRFAERYFEKEVKRLRDEARKA